MPRSGKKGRAKTGGNGGGAVAPQIVEGMHDAHIARALSLAAASPSDDLLGIMNQVRTGRRGREKEMHTAACVHVCRVVWPV